jgi:hypothetical protein
VKKYSRKEVWYLSKTSKGGANSLLAAGLIAAIGGFLLNKSQKNNDEYITNKRKHNGKNTVQQIDELTALITYMNKRLLNGTLDDKYYGKIVNQATKEYKQLKGHLKFSNGMDAYVDDRVNFIKGVEAKQRELRGKED